MRDGVFVCNCGIYSASICKPGLFVETIDINETLIVVND